MGRLRHPGLTPAELRVLAELRAGGTNGEIAERLGLSLNTVKYHVANMLAKLELPDRAALSNWRGDRTGPLRGAGWWMLAGGAAAVAVAVGAVVLLAFLSGSDGAGTPMEATPSADAVLPTPIPVGPPEGVVAFVGSRAGSDESQVFSVAAAGGSSTALTAGPGARFSPVWSPDGTRLAYIEVALDKLPIVAGSSDVGSLRLVSAEGGDGTTLRPEGVSLRPDGSVLERPSWRPDGARLVFDDHDFLAARVDVDGSNYRQEMLGCETPSWSPDGRLGTCSAAGGEGGSAGHLFLSTMSPEFRSRQNADGSSIPGSWVLEFGARVNGTAVNGVVNADSRWLAWWSYGSGSGDGTIWLARFDSATGRKIGDELRVGAGREPHWSPDGTSIVYSTATDDAFPQRLARSDIVRYDVATGRRTALVSGGSNRWPVWSADGRHVAFVSDRDDARGEIYVMESDGTGITRLTFNDLAESMLDWSR
jgi:Tol biopolymer transport system component/DNA-binding CsgD family transcriptional regulator